MLSVSNSPSAVVTLNVDNKIYQTTSPTLAPDRSSLQRRMESAALDPKNLPFIERNGENFRYVLQFLRTGETAALPPAELEKFVQEADYFDLQGIDAQKVVYDLCSAPKTSDDYFRNAVVYAQQNNVKEAVIAFASARELAGESATALARGNEIVTSAVEGLFVNPLLWAFKSTFKSEILDVQDMQWMTVAGSDFDASAVVFRDDPNGHHDLSPYAQARVEARPDDPHAHLHLAERIFAKTFCDNESDRQEYLRELRAAWQLAPGTSKFIAAYADALLDPSTHDACGMSEQERHELLAQLLVRLAWIDREAYNSVRRIDRMLPPELTRLLEKECERPLVELLR